jgi:hypothetical protein
MAQKILNVIETAYRGTLEEQDDTVVWLTHTLKGNGADIHVLLRGNAVNYAVRGQNASGLVFGQKQQTQPPQVDGDLASLIKKGVQVHYVEEDAAARGIAASELIEGLQPVRQGGLAALFDRFEQVWHW